MTSAIDATVPVAGTPTTSSVRANFSVAKAEITALQGAVVADTISSGIIAGGLTQATATQLSSQFNIVGNVPVPGAAVALPPGSPGSWCKIKNAGVNPLQVFPRLGDGARINTGAPDEAADLILQPDTMAWFQAESLTQWHV